MGCEFIATAKWPNLKELNLSRYYVIEEDNSIGEKGCRHLAKAKWNRLQTLILSSQYLIEVKTKSVRKAANI